MFPGERLPLASCVQVTPLTASVGIFALRFQAPSSPKKGLSTGLSGGSRGAGRHRVLDPGVSLRDAEVLSPSPLPGDGRFVGNAREKVNVEPVK